MLFNTRQLSRKPKAICKPRRDIKHRPNFSMQGGGLPNFKILILTSSKYKNLSNSNK